MIRHAKIQEAEILTKISFRSKKYWGHAKVFYDIWADELTIRPYYIQNNDVFVFENDGAINGYYSIVELKDDIEVSAVRISKGFWLEHICSSSPGALEKESEQKRSVPYFQLQIRDR